MAGERMRLRDLALSLDVGEELTIKRIDDERVVVRALYRDGTSTTWHRDTHITTQELTCSRIDLVEDSIDRLRHDVAGASGR